MRFTQVDFKLVCLVTPFVTFQFKTLNEPFRARVVRLEIEMDVSPGREGSVRVYAFLTINNTVDFSNSRKLDNVFCFFDSQ